jgi:hypothetical protein
MIGKEWKVQEKSLTPPVSRCTFSLAAFAYSADTLLAIRNLFDESKIVNRTRALVRHNVPNMFG